MATGPTILNGPLHTDEVSLSDRKITAYFASAAEAKATQDALLAAGIPSDRISLADATVEAGNLAPADDTIVGRIREAIFPDDSQSATHKAVSEGDVMLTVWPELEHTDRAIGIIQAGKPSHFDADLERWRNSPPTH